MLFIHKSRENSGLRYFRTYRSESQTTFAVPLSYYLKVYCQVAILYFLTQQFILKFIVPEHVFYCNQKKIQNQAHVLNSFYKTQHLLKTHLLIGFKAQFPSSFYIDAIGFKKFPTILINNLILVNVYFEHVLPSLSNFE